MTQASDVRTWAQAEGIEVSSKGRIAPAVWNMYAEAHGGTIDVEPDTGHAVGSCNCGRRWGGLREAHCATCHRHFSTPEKFDWHRAGTDGCADPLTVIGSDGEPKMRIRHSMWGPIYVSNKDNTYNYNDH